MTRYSVTVSGLGIVCETDSERTAKAIAKHYNVLNCLAGKPPVPRGRMTSCLHHSKVARYQERAASNPWGIEGASVRIIDNHENGFALAA